LINVTLYRKEDCPECDQTIRDLESLQSVIPHRLAVIDLSQHPELMDAFPQVPVVEAGPYRLVTPISRQNLQVSLGAARDRRDHAERVGDARFAEKVQRGSTVNKTDRATYWFSNHYMVVFNLIFALYVGIPWLAPVFEKAGWQLPARVIYTVYSPLCHQLAFRSWFLFGEQAAYPRQLAGVEGLIPFEQAIGINPTDTTASRSFTGNDLVGYKVALCERDIAIYGSILIFGLLFAATRMRLRHLPFLAWVLIGIFPIALDGFSQLPSLIGISGPAWLPIRESTPLLRTITGYLFGFTTAWYGYTLVEDTMRDTRMLLARKIAVTSLH